MTAQTNAMRMNYVKVKIGNTQQNRKWGDVDETIN